MKKFFDFVTLLGKLKKIERYKGQFYWKKYPQPARWESVADHTWRLGVLVLLIANRLSKTFDLGKALTMTIVHDVPEIITGDDSPVGEDGTGKNTYVSDAKIAAARQKQERKAAQKLFGVLTPDSSKMLFKAWLEYDEQKSFEAKVVKSLDKIEAMMQVLEYSGGNLFEEHLKFTVEYGLRGSNVDPAVAAFGQHVAKELKRRYKKFE